MIPEQVQEIEDAIAPACNLPLNEKTVAELVAEKKIEYIDLETMYCEHAEASFDLNAIRNSGLTFAYDAMYGAGQNVIRRLLPDTTFLHCDYNPSFDGQAPEPIHKNLLEFSEMIKLAGDIDCGLATDGDADRIGLYDHEGNFVDSHHIILLLIHYLVKYKKMDGKVCTAFSTTVKIKTMCQHYNLPLEVVKIGFKYICGIMIKEDVLIGGEESGGIAIKGHIPERDGVWMGLVIFEFMAKTGKSLRELIDEVYAITGPFAFERNDLHIKEELKNEIVQKCKDEKFSSFGPHKVQRTEDLDGWKYFLNEDEWIMIRASGTEPVLRTYAESNSKENALNILQDVKKELLG
jgi:phosphomannomutase